MNRIKTIVWLVLIIIGIGFVAVATRTPDREADPQGSAASADGAAGPADDASSPGGSAGQESSQ